MSFEIKRRLSYAVRLGAVSVGNHAPITVQSMTNTPTGDANATVAQILQLEEAGCEIIRVAVPDEEAAVAIKKIKQGIHIPLIADIHFDYRLALAAADAGADGLRINPGNIGGPQKVRAVADCARSLGLPIRIGVNAGSLDQDLMDQHKGATANAMVASALRQTELLRSFNFEDIKISLKSSNVNRTVKAYRKLAAQSNIPLHVGITEAGGLCSGVVKSSLGIGMLLAEGIGDTIRVSLTSNPIEEVRVGYEILKALDIRRRGPEIISCPTCGRCQINLVEIAAQIEQALWLKPWPLKIAVMGCVVNGPGEAREADIGIAGGAGFGILFKKGKIIKKIPQEKLVEELLKAVQEFNF